MSWAQMQSLPGTYALVLENLKAAKIVIGRWGHLCLEPGYYIYIGSAFGPGGVRARISRHCRREKSKRWHIDYLRESVEPVAIWYSHEPERLEHRWAQTMAGMPGMRPVSGFGSSDCRCHSHLFYTVATPELDRFVHLVGGSVHEGDCRSASTAAFPS
jgi:Uri superfamily endonuclease